MGGAKGGFKLINYVGGPIFAAFKAIKDDLMYLKQTGSPKMDRVPAHRERYSGSLQSSRVHQDRERDDREGLKPKYRLCGATSRYANCSKDPATRRTRPSQLYS